MRMKECSASKSELTITRKTTCHDECFSFTCGNRWDVLPSLKSSFSLRCGCSVSMRGVIRNDQAPSNPLEVSLRLVDSSF